MSSGQETPEASPSCSFWCDGKDIKCNCWMMGSLRGLLAIHALVAWESCVLPLPIFAFTLSILYRLSFYANVKWRRTLYACVTSMDMCCYAILSRLLHPFHRTSHCSHGEFDRLPLASCASPVRRNTNGDQGNTLLVQWFMDSRLGSLASNVTPKIREDTNLITKALNDSFQGFTTAIPSSHSEGVSMPGEFVLEGDLIEKENGSNSSKVIDLADSVTTPKEVEANIPARSFGLVSSDSPTKSQADPLNDSTKQDEDDRQKPVDEGPPIASNEPLVSTMSVELMVPGKEIYGTNIVLKHDSKDKMQIDMPKPPTQDVSPRRPSRLSMTTRSFRDKRPGWGRIPNQASDRQKQRNIQTPQLGVNEEADHHVTPMSKEAVLGAQNGSWNNRRIHGQEELKSGSASKRTSFNWRKNQK